ncbi:hypothetical protein LEP1GSC036_1248 [Leptospira weilii str. 2006001853]|uniref:Uncharacterized protein n=1 Tax=Leptospira weilii str. 2006001853 TaxID=1001589 RepID=A0A828Z105_9LEPT|nr:hypothetical protein LEP1GSC036_1248 [Leptospira weilii str. 2006001853]
MRELLQNGRLIPEKYRSLILIIPKTSRLAGRSNQELLTKHIAFFILIYYKIIKNRLSENFRKVMILCRKSCSEIDSSFESIDSKTYFQLRDFRIE